MLLGFDALKRDGDRQSKGTSKPGATRIPYAS
jgi:hypothetical protein